MYKTNKESILFHCLNENNENSSATKQYCKDNSVGTSKIFSSMKEEGGKLVEPGWGQAHAQVSWKAGKP